MQAVTREKCDRNRLLLKIALFSSLGGIAVIVALQIASISNSSVRPPYTGHAFAALILVALWSAQRLFRDPDASNGSKKNSLARIAGFAVASSGLLYFLVYAISLGCCGVEGIRFTNDNVLIILAAGVLLTLAVAFLRSRRTLE